VVSVEVAIWNSVESDCGKEGLAELDLDVAYSQNI
jgi:hypothetical protein